MEKFDVADYLQSHCVGQSTELMSPWEKATAGEVRGKRHLVVAIPTEDVLVLWEANAYSRHSIGAGDHELHQGTCLYFFTTVSPQP